MKDTRRHKNISGLCCEQELRRCSREFLCFLWPSELLRENSSWTVRATDGNGTWRSTKDRRSSVVRNQIHGRPIFFAGFGEAGLASHTPDLLHSHTPDLPHSRPPTLATSHTPHLPHSPPPTLPTSHTPHLPLGLPASEGNSLPLTGVSCLPGGAPAALHSVNTCTVETHRHNPIREIGVIRGQKPLKMMRCGPVPRPALGRAAVMLATADRGE
jgi:hypothetical protein